MTRPLKSNRISFFSSVSFGALALAGLLGLSACSKPTDATAENFTAGMNDYLAKRGDLCLAKNSWPIDVTQDEIDVSSRNSIQMPVLEKLGVVSSSVVEVDVKDEDEVMHHMKVRRYALTDAGKKSYVARDTVRRDGTKAPGADLCAAKLSLDKVVGWAPSPVVKTASLAGAAPSPEDDLPKMVVSYTYKIEPAAWMQDPEAQKAFPVVANVLHGAGTAQLTETFKLTSTGWVSVDI